MKAITAVLLTALMLALCLFAPAEAAFNPAECGDNIEYIASETSTGMNPSPLVEALSREALRTEPIQGEVGNPPQLRTEGIICVNITDLDTLISYMNRVGEGTPGMTSREDNAFQNITAAMEKNSNATIIEDPDPVETMTTGEIKESTGAPWVAPSGFQDEIPAEAVHQKPPAIEN